MSLYEGKTRINYYDLDYRGQLKLSALLKMVHIAAEHNINDLNLGYNVLHPLNMSFVVQRFGLAAHKMPTHGQEVTIRTWPAEISRGTFIRKGDMYATSGEKLMEWASLWVLFDIAARKVLKPSALPAQLPPFTEIDVSVQPEKVNLPENFGHEFSRHVHTARYADIDTNLHMNNSIYGDLIGNALYPLTGEPAPTITRLQLNFLRETQPGEQITITARQENGIYLIKGESPGKVAFLARVES
ncbi:MAG: thioesterase [Defluviitaleaceae bacterium]|nr:thioesterase [Defluviitaleaceae bacterium]